MEEAAVRSVNLRKVYRGAETVEALKGIDLEVHRGELFTLLGPNGAGKTTFLRIVSTQLLPTDGDVTVMGHSVAKECNEVREHIAVVPQDVATLNNFTPWDYSYYFGLLRGVSSSESKLRTEQALRKVDLWDLKDRTCQTLSGGQKRRAIIACVLSSGADVLMLDEPTSGLDAVARRLVWSALRDLVKTGKTIILTTHIMEEAEMISDRLAIINKGSVVACGRPEEIKELVRERFRVVVDGYLENMNEFGRVAKIGDRTIVYVKSQEQAIDLLKQALNMNLRAEAAPLTLEDVFVQLIEGLDSNEIQ